MMCRIDCQASPFMMMRNGTAKITAQAKLTLGKWRCQKWGASRGPRAMLSSIPTKGSTVQSGSWPTGSTWSPSP